MFHLQGTGKIRNGVELCEGKGKQSIKWALSSQLTGGAVEKNPTARQGDIGVGVPSLDQEDSPEEGNGNPVPCSCLGNPWTEETGRLQSLEAQSSRTEHDQCRRWKFNPASKAS